MDKKWIIMGISGVTNGGKTTLAKFFKKNLPCTTIINQDAYFLPIESPKHILVPELNHFNWEVLSSLDMEKMHEDILKILKNETITTPQLEENSVQDCHNKTLPLEELQSLRSKLMTYNLLIIEGFCIFNYEPIDKLCDLKFFITLEKDMCYKRRCSRTYDPPDVPGYFDKVVWPEYCKHYDYVKKNCKNVVVLNQDNDNHLGTIVKHLLNFI